MGKKYLDFEKPIAEIERKIEELKKKKGNGEVDKRGKILQLQQILNEKRNEIVSAVKNTDFDKFISTLKEAKSLKVLDPACGLCGG